MLYAVNDSRYVYLNLIQLERRWRYAGIGAKRVFKIRLTIE